MFVFGIEGVAAVVVTNYSNKVATTFLLFVNTHTSIVTSPTCTYCS